MLEFCVKNQIITRNDSFSVVADSKNYLEASFEFTEEWQDSIVAVFGGSDGSFVDVVLENGSCKVPWEVIKAPRFTVSVFCGDLVTANVAVVEVERSGYCQGDAPKPPTSDVYTQLLSLSKAPYIGENGNWYQWDKSLNIFADTGIPAQGEQGEVGYTPVKGTDYWTEEDKAEIVSEAEPFVIEGTYDASNKTIITDVVFADIQGAVLSGKDVICQILFSPYTNNTKFIPLTTFMEESYATFAFCEGDSTYVVRCQSDGIWEVNITALEMMSRMTKTLSSNSTGSQYPSAKAVVDYVTAQIGEVLGGES